MQVFYLINAVLYALFMDARVTFVVIPVGSTTLVERSAKEESTPVIDIIYVVTTIVFFALMIAYVAACDRLGRAADVERGGTER